MELLEAAMAFAIVMIIFSTIATGIVELILRLWGLRGWCLKRAIEELFDNVVWPRLQSRLDDASAVADVAKEKAKTDFSTGLLRNPAGSVPIVSSLVTGDRWISVLTTLAFAERLGRTEVGKAILEEGRERGEAELRLLVDDFVRTYDRFSRAASEVYRRNAQVIAIAVGIFLAIIANVDASRLVATLIEDPDLRSDLIQSADEVVRQNEAALERLEKAEMALTKGEIAGGDETAENASKGDAFGEIRDAINTIKKNQDDFEYLNKGRLPVGLGYFPHCYLSNGWVAPRGDSPQLRPAPAGGAKLQAGALSTGAEDQQSNADATANDKLQSIKDWSECRAKRPEYLGLWSYLGALWEGLPRPLFFQWLSMTILAGVLIGLGGPFWYHVFTSLSQLFQLLKAIGLGGTSRPEATPEQVSAKVEAEDSAKPEDIIDAFKTAAQVHANRD